MLIHNLVAKERDQSTIWFNMAQMTQANIEPQDLIATFFQLIGFRQAILQTSAPTGIDESARALWVVSALLKIGHQALPSFFGCSLNGGLYGFRLEQFADFASPPRLLLRSSGFLEEARRSLVGLVGAH